MKLEPNLIKEILIWCEENLPCKEKAWLASELEFKHYDSDQIIFHIKLLNQENYIDCIDSSAGNYNDYFLNHLSMNGYQYLNILRSKAWKTAQGVIHEFGVIFAEAAIRAVIDKYVPI